MFLILYFLIFLLQNIQCLNSNYYYENLNRRNFLIGISQIGTQNGLDTPCEKDLDTLLKAIDHNELWALKLIDSFGNIPIGLSWGNYFWFPSRELCNDFNDPYNISLSYSTSQFFNARSPYDMTFFMIYYNFSTPIYVDIKLQYEPVIHVGLCLPKSCPETNITNYANQYFSTKLFEPQEKFNINMKQIGNKIPEFKWSTVLNIGVVMLIFIIIASITLTILAEISRRLRNRRPEFAKSTNDQKSLTGTATATGSPPTSPAAGSQIKLKRQTTTLEDFLFCFDIRNNLIKTFQLNESARNFIPVIAGLRTVVCLWVTLFHVYYYSLFTIRNVPMVFAKLENILLQPVLQSCFYVDVFFVISAFLLVSNFLENNFYMETIRRNSFFENVKFFGKFVLHRYARIMPVLILTMILSEIVFDLLDTSSPFRMDKDSGLYCRENWWYNLLLINNILDLKYICSSWSWYLGCEMQFFIFFLLIIFIYIRNEKYGKITFVTSAIIFVLIGFFKNYEEGITFKIDKIYSTLEQLYVRPYIRINPYFGGIFMGWLYHERKTKKLHFNLIAQSIFWLISIVIFFMTILMPYWRDAPTILVSIIMSFGKLVFGLFIGTIIFLSQNGYGGLLDAFMSNELFLYLNKFCFSIYMIAPIVISANFGLRTESTLFSELSSAMDVIGVILISILGSILTVLFLEIPFMKLSNRFILPKKKC